MLVNRKKTDAGEPVKWLEMRWMRYEREEPWATMSTQNSKICEKQDPL